MQKVAGQTFVVTDVTASNKRKRDPSDEGPKPIQIPGSVENVRIPVSEGGNPDRKKTSLQVNADDNKKPTVESLLKAIETCKNDMAEYLEKVVPPEHNIPVASNPASDEQIEWDPGDNYTTRLKKTSATTFVKGFSDIKVRMACSAKQYGLVVDAMLDKMGGNWGMFGDKERAESVKNTLCNYVRILSNIVSKMP